MKQVWTSDEIIEHFTLLKNEQEFVKANANHNKLGKALLLKFFQYKARFPEDPTEIPQQAVVYSILPNNWIYPRLILKCINGRVVA
jgi:hypothetical protein